MGSCKVITYVDEYEMMIIDDMILAMSKHELTMTHLTYGDQSR